jgi:hypothetical protein
MPAEANVTFPGLRAVEFAGAPPANTHEYAAAAVFVENGTDPPAWMVTSAVGESIVPEGGTVEYGVSCRNPALEGTPRVSRRNSR